MTALIAATAVLGAALGRFFKMLVLAPLTASFWPHSALPKTVQFLALTASLQFGYTLIAWFERTAAHLAAGKPVDQTRTVGARTPRRASFE